LAEIRGTNSSTIQKFNLFLDPRGVMQSRSWLTNIPGLTNEKAHPVILHRKSDYARLVVEAAHVEHQHSVGIQAMNAEIRNEFAINGMGTLCHQIQSRRTECRKLKAAVNTQLMAPLLDCQLGQKLKQCWS
jgi:hypothetical protein